MLNKLFIAHSLKNTMFSARHYVLFVGIMLKQSLSIGMYHKRGE
jgi:hypothetical protein